MLVLNDFFYFLLSLGLGLIFYVREAGLQAVLYSKLDPLARLD